MTTLAFPSRPQLVRPVIVQSGVSPVVEGSHDLLDTFFRGRLKLTQGPVRTTYGIVWCVSHYGATPHTWLEFVWQGQVYFWHSTRDYPHVGLAAAAVVFAQECIDGTITNTPPSEARS